MDFLKKHIRESTPKTASNFSYKVVEKIEAEKQRKARRAGSLVPVWGWGIAAVIIGLLVYSGFQFTTGEITENWENTYKTVMGTLLKFNGLPIWVICIGTGLLLLDFMFLRKREHR